MFQVHRHEEKPAVVIRAATCSELTAYEKNKLASIEENAQENRIDIVSLCIDGNEQRITQQMIPGDDNRHREFRVSKNPPTVKMQSYIVGMPVFCVIASRWSHRRGNPFSLSEKRLLRKAF